MCGKTNSVGETACITSGFGRDAILNSNWPSPRLIMTGFAFLSCPMAYCPAKGSSTSAGREMIFRPAR